MAKSKDGGAYTPKGKKKAGGGGKKPLSGFMLFAKEHRPKLKEEHPDLTFGGVGKKLGEMWRALDEKTKENYKSGKVGGK
ncbi:high mobility group box domain containing protein [Nitzschia inconspicua]|uniref:HMG high mobility group box-containing protein n=1 Tax=Nitzschia inconspicua TaxID=303405 RepID=A0A9K3M727_9STRA|nr:HMG high mobility group box-containing protein [Nitzschia inconspicua]KAG7373321.1 high mobility group box domain containing protein [Nitzschia inconspicua]